MVDYDGVEVPGSPFPVNVTEGSDASRVKAYGPGLERGVTDEAAKFTVDTRGAGSGGLALLIEGPSDAKVQTNVNIGLLLTCFRSRWLIKTLIQ